MGVIYFHEPETDLIFAGGTDDKPVGRKEEKKNHFRPTVLETKLK
jgi:hypothetical protein